jgi:FkbM family methyltransferase
LGDVLVVGVNGDGSVRRLKGLGRPLSPPRSAWRCSLPWHVKITLSSSTNRQPSNPMQLFLHTPIPPLGATKRLPVLLTREGPHDLSLTVLDDFAAATHQLVWACGTSLLTHLSENDTYISGGLAARGHWEFAESALLLSLCRPGITVLDAGANVGYYTVLLGRALGAGGRVYAFEPEPDNFLVLLANVLLNPHLRPTSAGTTVCNTALADRPGTANLERSRGNLGLHRLTTQVPTAGCMVVPTTTVDAVRRQPDFPAPLSLLKADVQGAELSLLRGAEATLRADRPVLVLECEPYLTGVAACVELLEWLQAHGYGRVRLFHSDREAPAEVLPEFARLLTAEEAVRELRGGRVGPYGTVLAFPNA